MRLIRKLGSGQSSLVMVIAIVLSGLTGSYFISHSSAATASPNPTGYVDYCVLSGTTTVFYGWAYDPNEPDAPSSQPFVNFSIGSQAHNGIASSIRNYRDADINAYLNNHYSSSTVKPGGYGWSTSYTGLYKGNSYGVAGTVLNYGAGANSPLLIDSQATFGSGSGFPGGTVPDACLASKPAPPTPIPSPSPTPTPSPAPSGGSSGSSSSSSSHKTTTTTPTTTAPATTNVLNTADGVVSVGTLTASVKTSAGNASKLHIIYGPDVNNLTSSTEDQPTNGGDTTVNLDSLDALTTYQFAIVRTADDGTTTTSAPASFKTKGFTISLHFIDAKKKGVAGIKGSLNDDKKSKSTSDKGGTLSFTDLSSGAYTLSYQYQGKTHTEDFDTDNASVDTGDNNASDNTPQVAVLSDTVDVSKLGQRLGVGSGETKSSSKVGGIIVAILGLLVLAFLIWTLRRRRKQARAAGGSHDIIDQQMNQHANQQPAGSAAPAHMGESLRDMVIKSMHEEAQKKKQLPPS